MDIDQLEKREFHFPKKADKVLDMLFMLLFGLIAGVLIGINIVK